MQLLLTDDELHTLDTWIDQILEQARQTASAHRMTWLAHYAITELKMRRDILEPTTTRKWPRSASGARAAKKSGT